MVEIINICINSMILTLAYKHRRNQQSELLGSGEKTCDVELHGLEIKIFNGLRTVLTVPAMFSKS